MSEDKEVVEEEIEDGEFDQEAQERGAWAARGWDFDKEPEPEPEIDEEVEALVASMLKESEANENE